MQSLTVPTSEGDARAHLSLPTSSPKVDRSPLGAVMLGHGAGGGVEAPDIRTAERAAIGAGWAVARVEQPYRVAGKRAAAPAARLDPAWVQVAAALVGERGPFAGLALVTGGRSSGARVACRTAQLTGAVGVLCLAFPLRPPARAGATRPTPSRHPELDGAGVPVLVIQGRSDRFGMPRSSSRLQREVVRVDGDHGLKRDHAAIASAIARWLTALS